MRPEQPIKEFRIGFNNRQEALEPETRTLTDGAWKHFLELISEVNAAHPRIQEGTWYLRHSLIAARQDVTAWAECALDTVRKMKDDMAAKGLKDPAFEDLADFAIAFTQSICEDPRILSIGTPTPPSSVRSTKVPQFQTVAF